jgi:hypothetical protein
MVLRVTLRPVFRPKGHGWRQPRATPWAGEPHTHISSPERAQQALLAMTGFAIGISALSGLTRFFAGQYPGRCRWAFVLGPFAGKENGGLCQKVAPSN